MSRRFDILLANLFGIFAVLSLPLPLVTFDGLPFVGVVQLAGELDIDFRATVNLSFAQEFVQQYAESEQGSHGHRIPDSRDARRTQLQETLSVGRRRRIRLNHRRMVKALQPLLLYAPITPQRIRSSFRVFSPSPKSSIWAEIPCSTSRRLAGSAYTSAGSTFPRLAKNTASS